MGRVKFNVPINLPNGNVKREAAHVNLDFIEDISAGDGNFGVISFKTPLKQ